MVLFEIHNHHDEKAFEKLIENLQIKQLILTNYYEKFKGFSINSKNSKYMEIFDMSNDLDLYTA